MNIRKGIQEKEYLDVSPYDDKETRCTGVRAVLYQPPLRVHIYGDVIESIVYLLYP